MPDKITKFQIRWNFQITFYHLVSCTALFNFVVRWARWLVKRISATPILTNQNEVVLYSANQVDQTCFGSREFPALFTGCMPVLVFFFCHRSTLALLQQLKKHYTLALNSALILVVFLASLSWKFLLCLMSSTPQRMDCSGDFDFVEGTFFWW